MFHAFLTNYMKKSDNYLSLTGKYTNIRCRYLQGLSQTFHLQLHLHDLLAQYRFWNQGSDVIQMNPLTRLPANWILRW